MSLSPDDLNKAAAIAVAATIQSIMPFERGVSKVRLGLVIPTSGGDVVGELQDSGALNLDKIRHRVAQVMGAALSDTLNDPDLEVLNPLGGEFVHFWIGENPKPVIVPREA